MKLRVCEKTDGPFGPTRTSQLSRPAGRTKSFEHAAGCVLAVIAAPGLAGAPERTAQAQAFPTKVVRIVVPTTPGGTLDLAARLIAQDLSRSWGQGVIVENRAGAGGMIGIDTVAKATPDGHTMTVLSSQFTVIASVYRKLPYDSLRDFAPVTLLAYTTWIMVVNPALPVHSVKELIALAKERPGQINYASLGNGGSTHLLVEMLKSMVGISLVHVPYKGSVLAVNDVIGGQVELTVTGLASMPQVTSGKLRVIAVTGAHRSKALPEVPTIGETVPGYEYNNWLGVLAPRATPNNIVMHLHGGILRALQSKEVKQLLLAAQSIEPVGSSPAQFGDVIRQEIGKYTRLAKDIGVRID